MKTLTQTEIQQVSGGIMLSLTEDGLKLPSSLTTVRTWLGNILSRFKLFPFNQVKPM